MLSASVYLGIINSLRSSFLIPCTHTYTLLSKATAGNFVHCLALVSFESTCWHKLFNSFVLTGRYSRVLFSLVLFCSLSCSKRLMHLFSLLCVFVGFFSLRSALFAPRVGLSYSFPLLVSSPLFSLCLIISVRDVIPIQPVLRPICGSRTIDIMCTVIAVML